MSAPRRSRSLWPWPWPRSALRSAGLRGARGRCETRQLRRLPALVHVKLRLACVEEVGQGWRRSCLCRGGCERLLDVRAGDGEINDEDEDGDREHDRRGAIAEVDPAGVFGLADVVG